MLRLGTHSSDDTRSGLVLTLGEGDVGQLGLGEEIMERKRPAIVPSIADRSVVQVVCGGMHTVALTTDGKVYSWGCNDEGALGRRTSGMHQESVPGLVSFPEHVVQVSAGDSHTVALTDDGKVFCWGSFRDANGPIGLTPDQKKLEIPIKIIDNTSSYGRAVGISSGNDHVAVVTSRGILLSWGVAEQGQLGRIAECLSVRGGRRGLAAILNPGVVRFTRRHGRCPFITNVFCVSYHTFAISSNDEVFAWGLNNYGQLGLGDTTKHFMPGHMTDLPSHNGKKVSLVQFTGGQHHSIALGSNGRVYVMGRTDYGRLGLGEGVEEPHIPVEIPEFQNVKVVAGGGAVSLAVTNEGVAYAWGMGTNYQLAADEDNDVHSPDRMRGKNLEGKKVISISAGGQHTALLVCQKD